MTWRAPAPAGCCPPLVRSLLAVLWACTIEAALVAGAHAQPPPAARAAAGSARDGAGPTAATAAGASVFLEDLTWTELREAVRQGHTTAIVPVGGTEQSGPALALGKHNVRVRLLSGRIARALGNAIVAPVIAYVPEGAVNPPSSHMRFAGTISVPTEVFESTLMAAGRSLRQHGFQDIVFLGDHGGYQAALARVARRLDHEWAADSVRAFAPPEYCRAYTEDFARLLRARGIGDDEIGTHAALADTSLQLAVDPDQVRTGILASGTRLDETVGIYGGNPRRASAQLGQAGIDLIVDETVAAIRQQVALAVRGRAARR